MVGYSDTAKAYRLWHPESRKVFVSRDVKFVDENYFDNEYEEILGEEGEGEVSGNDKKSSPSNYPMIIEYSSEEDDFHEEIDIPQAQENDDDPEDPRVQLEVPAVRGRGRPRLVRTGQRGRPRKMYNQVQRQEENEINANDENDDIFEDAEENIPMDEIVNLVEDPITLEEAKNSDEADEWQRAMENELLSQIKNKTWEITPKPDDRKAIGNRYVFKTKEIPGTVSGKKKVRLVAKGCSQKCGEDYFETYSPVARLTSVRVMAALAAELGLQIHQMDVVTAYLNGNLNTEVYMKIPDGLENMLDKMLSGKSVGSSRQIVSEACILETAENWKKELQNQENKVCLLKKAIYGLKQAGVQWNKRLVTELKKLGLQQLTQDQCMFIAYDKQDIMIVLIYVDDMLIASANTTWINQIKSSLSKVFEMKNLGEVTTCLGIEFSKSNNGKKVKLSQKKYIEDILERFNMSDCKVVSTPIEANCNLEIPKKIDVNELQSYPYRQLIGALMYLAISTRPDIAYAVSYLSQFNSCYSGDHWKAAKRVLRYLKGTINVSLEYKRTGKPLYGVADADWAGDRVDRKSYTGYAFILAGAAISWEARKQRTVALSSTEAEYMAMSESSREALYLQELFCQLGMLIKHTTIYNDNQSAHKLVYSQAYHSRTKHIDVRYHFIRHIYYQGRITPVYMPTNIMPADMLTKGLTAEKIIRCSQGLGLKKWYLLMMPCHRL